MATSTNVQDRGTAGFLNDITYRGVPIVEDSQDTVWNISYAEIYDQMADRIGIRSNRARPKKIKREIPLDAYKSKHDT